MKTQNLKTFKRTALLLTLTASVAFSQTALAQNDNRGSDKVDLKKLEDKYWSSKDDDYAVIQNRTFAKAGKLYLTLGAGPLVNDQFAKSRAFGGMLGYYINEDFGLEASYLGYNSTKSTSVENFNTLAAAGVSPNYNLLKSSMALSMSYTPFYAKMAFMNKAILYFDMGFTLGAGVSSYEQVIFRRDGLGNALGEAKESASAPHFEIGVMQQLFLNKNFAFRADIKNSFYSQTIKVYDVGVSGNQNARPEEKKSANDTTIILGLTFFTN
jgi:outer membrane beta-barrel protein